MSRSKLKQRPSLVFVTFLRVLDLFYWLIATLLLFYPKLRQRFREEFAELGSLSSDYRAIFSVSSEGEIEQIYPLLEQLLDRDEKVLLLLSSKSGEKKMRELKQNFPEQLDWLLLPLLNFKQFERVKKNISCQDFYFCRYDFYPHLLLAAKFFMAKRLILVSASLKGKSLKGASRWYWKNIYHFFEIIIFASKKQEELAVTKLGLNMQRRSFDFRLIRVKKRVQMAEEALLQKWPEGIDQLREKILPIKDRSLVMGSAWPQDIDFFSRVENHPFEFLFIAPHRLDSEGVNQLLKVLADRLPEHSFFIWRKEGCEINKKTSHLEKEAHLLLVPGILCEIYTLFRFAYVGGGFGRSIHSVLEPYLAGCSVICGPRVHRSTEVDMILEEDKSELLILKNTHDFESIRPWALEISRRGLPKRVEYNELTRQGEEIFRLLYDD